MPENVGTKTKAKTNTTKDTPNDERCQHLSLEDHLGLSDFPPGACNVAKNANMGGTMGPRVAPEATR